MRLLFGRPAALLTAAIIAYVFVYDGTEAGQQAAVIAVVLWIAVLAFRRAWSCRRQRTPRALIAKPSRSIPWGRREADVRGCFGRLDPAWQLWLQPEVVVSEKRN